MKIAAKISLAFLIVSVVLTSIAAPAFYLVSRADLLDEIDMRLDSLVAEKARHIKTYLMMLKVSLLQLSKSVVLENFLKADKKGAESYGKAFAVAIARLENTQKTNPSIFEFLLLDKKGMVVASSDGDSIGVDMSADALFAAGQKRTFIKDAYYSGRAEGPLMAVSAPMFDSDTAELLGVVVAKVTMDDLDRIVTENINLGKSGEMFIVNKYGYLITPTRAAEDTFLKKRVDTENLRSCLANRDKGGICNLKNRVIIAPDFRVPPVMVVGSNAYIPEMQWCLLSKIDRDEALAPLRTMKLMFIAVMIGSPLGAWLLGIFLSVIIARPIKKLHRGTEIIGKGDLDYKVSTSAKDEIGQLSRAFDTMTENLKHTTTSVDRLNEEIIQRKQAERGLRALAAIVESSDDAIIGKDPNGVITSWNKGAERLYGYSEKEVVGRSVSIIIPGERQDELARIMRKIEEGQFVEHFETLRRKKDGTVFPVSLTISPIKGAGGSIVGASTIARDITERKKAEEKLAASEVRYRRLFETAKDGILILDAETGLLDNKEILNKIKEVSPRYIGITSTTPEFPRVKELFDAIKKVHPGVVTVAGGPHFSAVPECRNGEYNAIDYIVVGEGEKALLKIVSGGAKEKIVEVVNEDPLDDLPLPARHLVSYSAYQFPIPGRGLGTMDTILTSRGCPFSCLFCFNRNTKVRYRNTKKCVDEILLSHEKYRTKFFMFLDDTLTVSKERIAGLCEEIMKRNLHKKVLFYANARADRVDFETLKMMKQAGVVEISMGIESGSQQILNMENKGTKLEQYEKVYSWMRKLGFETRGSFILGHPYETRQTVRDTINFAKKLKLVRVSCCIMTPYPGTEVYNMALRNQGIRLVSRNWGDFTRYGRSVVRTDELKKEDLENYQKMFLTEFYTQPKVIFHHLLQLLRGNFSLYYYRPILFAIWRKVRFVLTNLRIRRYEGCNKDTV